MILAIDAIYVLLALLLMPGSGIAGIGLVAGSVLVLSIWLKYWFDCRKRTEVGLPKSGDNITVSFFPDRFDVSSNHDRQEIDYSDVT